MRKKPVARNHCLDCGALCWHTRCASCAAFRANPPRSMIGEDEMTLRRRWARGDRTADIGIGLGVTKNAVIGKASRLGLGQHPNAGPLQSHRWPQMDKGPYPYEVIGPRDCRWPIGDPNKPGFHFCGAPAQEGYPYCATHKRRAYEKAKPMAEAAD